jgi:thiamine biosynthesis lipoprotein
VTSIALDDRAIATSGDAWHAFEHEGRRYSHTLDPRTGWPVDDALASVTVVAAECADADALATALWVLGAEAGLEFAQHHAIAALFHVRQGQGVRQRMSAAFASLAR